MASFPIGYVLKRGYGCREQVLCGRRWRSTQSAASWTERTVWRAAHEAWREMHERGEHGAARVEIVHEWPAAEG